MMKDIARTALAAVAFLAAATTASAQTPITQEQTLQVTAEATHVFEMSATPIPVTLLAAAAGVNKQEGSALSSYSFATSHSGQEITVALEGGQGLPAGLKVFVTLANGEGEVEVAETAKRARLIGAAAAASEEAVTYRVEAPLGIGNGEQIVLVYTLQTAI